MTMQSNFRTYLEPQDLEAIRKLARNLDMTLTGGQLAGEGSPRQVMIALAEAVRRHGVRNVAAALKPLFAADEAEAG
jgi:hypothetical protein